MKNQKKQNKITNQHNNILGLDIFGLAHLSTHLWGLSFLPPVFCYCSNIVRRNNNFYRIIIFKSPVVGNSPWDEMEWDIWIPATSVGAELWWLQLVFSHAWTQKSWLDQRYLDFRLFYRMWCCFIYYDNWDLFENVRDLKLKFYEQLNYWKTTFDDVLLSWVLLRPPSWMILYQPRGREIFTLYIFTIFLVL